MCTEIIEYTSKDEVAVCNLGSIALNMCVETRGDSSRSFSFEALERVTRVLARNLNRVIDISHYPVEQAKFSNLKNRPIGIGVQGLADAFAMLRIDFESEEAARLNRQIFETIYYAAVDESCRLAH